MKTPLTKDKDYISWFKEIKSKVYTLQVKSALAVNAELLAFYWELGKDIVEKQATKNWGDSIVEQLGKDLQSEFPEIKGFSRRNLFYIKGWYLFYNQEIGKVQQVVAQLCSSSEITSTELVQQAVALINTSSKNISIEKVQQLVGQIPWGYN